MQGTADQKENRLLQRMPIFTPQQAAASKLSNETPWQIASSSWESGWASNRQTGKPQAVPASDLYRHVAYACAQQSRTWSARGLHPVSFIALLVLMTLPLRLLLRGPATFPLSIYSTACLVSVLASAFLSIPMIWWDFSFGLIDCIPTSFWTLCSNVNKYFPKTQTIGFLVHFVNVIFALRHGQASYPSTRSLPRTGFLKL